MPEFEKLKTLLKSMKELADFFASDECQKQLERLWLRESRLVILLCDIAMEIARADHWVVLTRAAQLIRQRAPEEMEALKKRYGYKTLKELILATELFDVDEEPTDKDGVRVLYRIKPEQYSSCRAQ